MIQQHGFAPSLRERLDADQMVFGLFLAEMRTPNFGLLLDGAGYDFAIFDLEHGVYSLADLAGMLPGFRGGRCSPLVRVPAVRREWFQATLDLGAAGIVVPVVESADDVRRAVELMKYPPQGKTRRRVLPSPFAVPVASKRRVHRRGERARDPGDPDRDRRRRSRTWTRSSPYRGSTWFSSATPTCHSRWVCPNDLNFGPLCDAMERIVRVAAARGIPAGANLVERKTIARLKEIGLRFVSLTTDVDRSPRRPANGDPSAGRAFESRPRMIRYCRQSRR